MNWITHGHNGCEEMYTEQQLDPYGVVHPIANIIYIL